MDSSAGRSVLHRFTRQEEGAATEEEGDEDLGAFGWQRGRERCLMLELRQKGGNVLVLGYAWLHRIELDPSEGLVLWFAGQKVCIRGRNLGHGGGKLLDGLVRHRVRWIREAGQDEVMQAPNDACVVESMHWDRAK